MLFPIKIVGLLLAFFVVLLSGTASAQAPGVGYTKGPHKGAVAVQVELPGALLAFDRRGGDHRGRGDDDWKRGRRDQRYERGGWSGHRGRRSSHLPPRWVPGHYETVVRPVWIPGAVRREWVPAQYGLHYDSRGRKVQVLVQAGHWVNLSEPGCYEQRAETVWVPGQWVHGS